MLGDPVDERAGGPDPPFARAQPRDARAGRVDLCFLHTYIVDDGRVLPQLGEFQARRATSWTTYADAWRPTMAALVDEGTVGAWGITGTGPPDTVLPRCGTSPARGGAGDREPARLPGRDPPLRGAGPPREIIATAAELGIGVLGIRAVGAGAITDALDRDLAADDPVAQSTSPAAAPVRELAGTLGMSTATLAHRYALGMPGVDSVVLGVKNRDRAGRVRGRRDAGPLRRAEAEVGRAALTPHRSFTQSSAGSQVRGFAGGVTRRRLGILLAAILAALVPIAWVSVASSCTEPKPVARGNKVLVVGDSLTWQSIPQVTAALRADGWDPTIQAASGTTIGAWAGKVGELIEEHDPTSSSSSWARTTAPPSARTSRA